MSAVCGITSLKEFTYRGLPEAWSNTYWFEGAIPSDNTAWKSLYDALVLQEKTFLPPAVTLIGAYGYDDNSDDRNAVYHIDMKVSPNAVVAGTYSGGGAAGASGDAAMWIRWGTSRNNTNGRKIYLRKYYHGVYNSGGAGFDALLGTQKTALSAFGAKMMDGSFIDGRTLRSRLHDETLVGHAESTYITTRTLKRRGKRPGA